jgi:hypothetical protein
VTWVMLNLASIYLETVLVSVQVEARLVYIEILLIWTHDGCMVSAEHTIDLEIILDLSDGTSR